MSAKGNEWRVWVGPQDMPEPDRERKVSAGGIDLHCFEFGSEHSDAVLLLHGGLGSSEDFGGQIPELAKKRRVISVDTRGHGRSADAEQAYSYELFAQDMIAVMDQLGIGQTDIVGWSDGANTGMALASKHPDRISKLVALGGNFSTDGLRPSVFADNLVHVMTEECESRYRGISPNPDEWPSFCQKVIDLWMGCAPVTEQELAGISVPVLVATGVYEEAIDEAHTRKLAELIPGAKLWLIDNSSHFAMWQEVDAVNAGILEFLTGQIPEHLRKEE